MNRRSVSLSAVLYLSMMITSALAGSAQQVQPLEPEWLRQMYEEGWQKVQEGVLQRDTGGGQLETFGYGSEGLQWIVQGFEQRVRDLEEKYNQSPTAGLALAIAQLKGEIARLNEVYTAAPSVDRFDNEALETCAPSFGGSASAGPQPGPLGVVATASAYFYSDCGQLGDTFATAYAHAIDGTVETTNIQSDPKNGGAWLDSQAIAGAHGSTGCESWAQASVTSNELSISYQTPLIQNFSCVYDTSTHTLDVKIVGPSESSPSPSTTCLSIGYYVQVTGGAPAYTTKWYIGNTHVATGPTYSKSFCGQEIRSQTLNLKVFTRDSAGHTGEDTHTTTIYYNGT